MEKTQYSQLELFTEKQNLPVEKRSIHSSLLRFIKAYEKVTIVLICTMVVAIGAFSLGVEKGKTLSPARPPRAAMPQEAITQTPDAARSTPSAAAETAPAPVVQVPAGAPVRIPEITSEQNSPALAGGFTVQVACYQNRVSAQKEAEALKKNGFPVTLSTKGKYTVLCVGRFSSRKAADMMLAKIKKQYQGSFVRRL